MKAFGRHFSVKYVFLQIIILLCVLLIVYFRTVPVTRLWNGYKVLYVDKSVNESEILSCLYDSGCKNVIALSLQKIPITTPFIGFQGNDSYLENRLGYFSDRNSDYNLFYIPDEYEKNCAYALKNIVKSYNVRAGIDCESTVPYVVPVISMAVYLALGFLSVKKRYFFLPSFFIVLLSFSMPFYTVSSGIILFLFAIFLSNRLWGRKSDVSAIFRNHVIEVLAVSAIVLLFSHSLACAFLSVASICACAASIVLLKEANLMNDRQSSFTYSLIFSAYQVSVNNKRNMNLLFLLTVPLGIIILAFGFSAKFMPYTSSVPGIELPSPVSRGNEDTASLPTINDYFVWAWNTLTYPYRSLNYIYPPTVTEGDSVYMSRFIQKDSGIQEKNSAVYTYNNDFRKQLEKDLDNLDYPAVELLMEKQGRNVEIAYAVSKQAEKSSNDVVNLILLMAALVVPLILCLSYYHGVGRRI